MDRNITVNISRLQSSKPERYRKAGNLERMGEHHWTVVLLDTVGYLLGVMWPIDWDEPGSNILDGSSHRCPMVSLIFWSLPWKTTTSPPLDRARAHRGHRFSADGSEACLRLEENYLILPNDNRKCPLPGLVTPGRDNWRFVDLSIMSLSRSLSLSLSRSLPSFLCIYV
jgi:hypothetical protein